VALFVLVVVGIVVAQTWLDWRETRKNSPLPSWAKGMAMASVLAISLASAASYASVWIEGSGQSTASTGSQFFWPELGVLLCALGIVILTARQKRIRWMFILTGIVVAAFWLGLTLSA
jgi:hypothetical protein